ncbi:MAG: hypothetical protein OEX07_09880, partial [Gammaproteobacteria bacterium]|nr:hypothetical protein [Gammaproteobacteria bacterium]
MSTHFIRLPLLRLLSSWFLPGAWSNTQVNIPAKIMAVIITTLPFGLTPALVHALENSPAHCSSASSANASNTKSYADTTSTANKIPSRSTTITDKSVHLGADSLLSNQSNLFIVDGNVSIQTRLYSIEADSAKYNHRQHHLTAQGNITYRDENKFIESDNLDLNLESGIGEANNTRYRLLEQNTNGVAGQISFKDSQLTLSRSTYSTCEENEDERKAWQIRANSIELHPEQNEGIARNMQLEILNVPVLYLPYISFPLEGRKSGFL